jgi:hypothetical protein
MLTSNNDKNEFTLRDPKKKRNRIDNTFRELVTKANSILYIIYTHISNISNKIFIASYKIREIYFEKKTTINIVKKNLIYISIPIF